MHRVNPEERPKIDQILEHPRIKQLQLQSQRSGQLPNLEMLESGALNAANELATIRENETQRFAELEAKIQFHEIVKASPMEFWFDDPQLGLVIRKQESLQRIPSKIQNTRYKSVQLTVPYLQNRMSTVSLDPVFDALPDRIQFIRLTARFYDSPKGNLRRIGIVDAKHNIPEQQALGFDDYSIGYDGASGRISHCGSPVCKADQYGNEDFVTIEVYLPPILEMQAHPQQPRDPGFATTLYRTGGGYNWYVRVMIVL
ncbi:MAG: hypothetical protein EZS28_040574 [Streblomastix strix]|uniref:Uncharacterized protein n=1 Tax=Streblomastix strix TaxID=222440 RepID=A0A5J4U0W1_9EUKA|nr:MAG: hypothetical protein EZS28_040574 [Streblomastix strix]